MRPTGRLHLGNYVGALENWVHLQDEYENFCFVADWHALTTDFASGTNFRESSIQVAIDFLAAGLDPERSTIFLQSSVLEHSELHLLLSMVTPLGWLERVPSYKELQENIDHDINTYGFLGYPVLQSADILIYKAVGVPVGEDQVAHVGIDPGDRPPLQSNLCKGFPRAESAADPNAQTTRNGRAENEQELRQHDRHRGPT